MNAEPIAGWWITNLFFELPIFWAHLVHLNLQPLQLVLFLEPTFESALPILKKPPLSFAHVGTSDFLFNLVELACRWALRLRWHARIIWERIDVVLLARNVLSQQIILVLVVRALVFEQLVHRGILLLGRCSVGRAIFSFPFICFGLRTILISLLSVLLLTRL